MAAHLKDPWYTWAAGVKAKPWGPHLPLTAQSLLSVSYHTHRDQRWRHLWEEDRGGGNRNERVDAKVQAEEDAATATMAEKQRLEFQLQRAADRKDAAWKIWKYEKNQFDQGIGHSVRVDAAKAALNRLEREFDVVLLQRVEAPPVSTQEELAAKLLAAEELIQKLQKELAKTKEDLNAYTENFYDIKRRCCCHAAERYRGCPECEGDSDYEGECECTEN